MSTVKIAENYGKWMKSYPFDIGFATKTALRGLAYNPDPEVAKLSAYNKNQGSCSNGSLMRVTPLAVWGSNLESPSDLYKAIKADA